MKYYKAEDVEKLLSCGCAYAIRELPTIEVGEDCIDRYSALAELDPRSYEYKAVKELPSVVPKEKADKSLKKQLKDIKTVGTIATEEEYGLFGCRFRTVEHAPSVILQPKEGEWVNKQEKYQMAECSNCKKVTMHEMWGDKLVYYDYCPNCGCRMKGADDE